MQKMTIGLLLKIPNLKDNAAAIVEWNLTKPILKCCFAYL